MELHRPWRSQDRYVGRRRLQISSYGRRILDVGTYRTGCGEENADGIHGLLIRWMSIVRVVAFLRYLLASEDSGCISGTDLQNQLEDALANEGSNVKTLLFLAFG